MDPELYNAVIDGSESFFGKIKNVDLNLQLTSRGNSLLHVAAKSGKEQIVEEILNNSQPSLMYMTNSEGNTPLHIAASLGHLKMTQLLINRAKLQEVEDHNVLLRMVNLEQDTAMHGAVRNDCYEIVKILIREDPSLVSSTNSVGESPLFLAVDRGFYEIALHILKIVPKCSYEGRNKMNVLHVAAIRMLKCKQFKEEKVSYTSNALALLNQFLLKSSYLKFESTSKISVTCADFVRELVNNRPSALLEKDDFGWIPLHHAAHAGNAEVVELFLEIFIEKKEELFLKINHLACIKDKEGMSALQISAKEGHVDVMRTLITKCPEICELLDTRGRTALHVAVESGKSDAVKILLETQAFQDLINKKDKEGNTPVHLAAVKGSFAVLFRMARNGKVDKGATNKKGMTAIDIVPSNMQRLKQEDINDMGKNISEILKGKGFLPSLQQGVTREATEANRHGQSQQTETKDEAVKDMANTTHQENAEEKEYERKKDMANTNLLIATIIATVTFAAGIAVPGGYNTSIESLHTLSRNSSALRGFVMFNSLAFSCSSASMSLHFILSLVPRVFAVSYLEQLIMGLTYGALAGMMFAFMAGTLVVFPNDSLVTLPSHFKPRWLSATSVLTWVVPVSTGFSIVLLLLYFLYAIIIKVRRSFKDYGESSSLVPGWLLVVWGSLASLFS